MSSATPAPSAAPVVVGVPTFRRPERLAALLPRLVDEVRRCETPGAVVVVDNDPAGSAREIVERAASVAEGVPVRYVLEDRPGIAAARNRVLDEAEGADAVVFIDDDEVPGPGWLETLTTAWRRERCAAVSGPRVFVFDGEVDPWVQGCLFFRRRRMATGTRRAGAATNNLLLDLGTLRRLGLRFDDRFGLTGGEDTLLTRQLVQGGGEIVWIDEAEVHEAVPPERATREWVLARHRRTGTIWARVQLELAGAGRARTRRGLRLRGRASLRLARGVTRLAVARVRRDVTRVAHAEEDIVTGLGVLEGVRGHAHVGYGDATAP